MEGEQDQMYKGLKELGTLSEEGTSTKRDEHFEDTADGLPLREDLRHKLSLEAPHSSTFIPSHL